MKKRQTSRMSLALLSATTALALLAPGANAVTTYLDLNSTDPGFGTAGSPDITTSATWTTDPTGVANPGTFVAANFMQIGNVESDFDGSTISILMNLANNLTANPGGLKIVSTNAIITLAGTSNCRYNQTFSWTVASGSTLIITSTGNNNGWNFNSRTCTFAGGGIIDFKSAFCANGNALNTMNMPGGTLKLEQTATSNFGNAANGAFTLTAGTLQFVSPESLSRAFGNWNFNNTWTINGGAIDNLSGAPGTIILGTSGKYTYGGDWTFAGSSDLSMGVGPVTLTGNRAITVSASTLTIGGAISGVGFGLTKNGPGGLTLGGASTYTGDTIVNAGTLGLTNAGSIASSSQLALNAAKFDITGLASGATTLITFSPTNSTLNIAPTSSTLTNIAVTTLNAGGTTNLINISDLPLITGYPLKVRLIAASTVNGTLNFGLASLPASTPAYVAYITNDTAVGAVDLVVTGGPVPVRSLKWNGLNGGIADGTWDVGTTPTWLNAATPATFNQSDFVTFDDTAAGQTGITMNTTVMPGTLTVSNNTKVYTLGGNGKISGEVGLTKLGSGTLILDDMGINDFTGPVTISAGTLQLGNNSFGGNLPMLVPVVNNSALAFQRMDFITISNAISGTGTVTQNGAGAVTLSGANTFTGAVMVAQGTLVTGSSAALGTTNGITTIANGATLDIGANAINLGQEQVTVSGSGVNGLGALVNNSGSVTFVGPNVARVTLAGDTVVGGTGRFDLRSANTGDPTLASLSTLGQPRKLTKVGSAAFGLIGITVDPALGDIDIQSGIFSIEAATTGLGNSASNLVINPGGTFQMFAATNQINKVITAGGDGSTMSVSATSGTGNTIVGPMSITNDIIINVNNNVALTLNGALAGPGRITKISPGLLTIAGDASAYTGGIQLNAGNVTAGGTMSNLLGVTVSAGKFTINGSLKGGGITNYFQTSVAGSGTSDNVADITGNLFPGDTNVLGTFTSSGLILQGGASLYFDLGSDTTPGGGTNDLIQVNGDLTVSGNTITINPLSQLQTGVPYTLIRYTGTLTWNGDPFAVGINNYIFTVNTNTPGEIRLVATGGPPIWTGGSLTSNNWSDPANWGGVTINIFDSLFFNGTNRLNSVNDTPAGNTYTDLAFHPGAGAFVLSGNPVDLGGNIINNSPTNQTINLPLTFSAARTLNGGALGSLTIGGGITNTSATFNTLTLAGNGTLTNLLSSSEATGTNTILLNTSNANWTLLDNAASAPVTLPWLFNDLTGSFTFGSAGSAPTFTSTTVNGAPQDNVVGGGTAGTAVFNMVNGSLTLIARLNTGTAGGATGIVNQVGGTLTIGGQFQGANGAATAASYVNVGGGTMNIMDTALRQFYVASRGPGYLTVSNSGSLNCSILDVSRSINSSIPGVVNLDGGTITCSRVGTATANAGAATTGSSGTFNFNGGTLKANASAANFFQGNAAAPAVPLAAVVKAGGAIIDDGGFTITIAEPLSHDAALGANADGGLTKTGPGTLTLSAPSTYTGATTISNGVLAVNGSLSAQSDVTVGGGTLAGTGTIGGAVNVGAAGAVAPGAYGAIGTLTVQKDVTLGGNTAMDVNKTAATKDLLNAANITYGGTLSVTNIAGSLAGGDSFKLFNATTYTGSFNALNPSTPGAGLAWDTSSLTNNGTLLVKAVAKPGITGISLIGGSVVITGTNGSASSPYWVLTATNLALPVSSWTILATNNFDASGNFNFTNGVPSSPQQFYLLQLP